MLAVYAWVSVFFHKCFQTLHMIIFQVFILRELALCTPTLFYQSIARFFDSIFKPIRDPKSLVRVQAVAALRAALGIVAQRENQEDSFYKVSMSYLLYWKKNLIRVYHFAFGLFTKWTRPILLDFQNCFNDEEFYWFIVHEFYHTVQNSNV